MGRCGLGLIGAARVSCEAPEGAPHRTPAAGRVLPLSTAGDARPAPAAHQAPGRLSRRAQAATGPDPLLERRGPGARHLPGRRATPQCRGVCRCLFWRSERAGCNPRGHRRWRVRARAFRQKPQYLLHVQPTPPQEGAGKIRGQFLRLRGRRDDRHLPARPRRRVGDRIPVAQRHGSTLRPVSIVQWPTRPGD